MNYETYRLHRMATLATGNRILDVGCAFKPNRFLKGQEVVGLDLDQMAVASPYTKHVVGNVFDLDKHLPNQQFDTILLGEFIEHVETPYALLRQFRGMIAPQGRLVLSTPNPLGIPAIVAEYLLLRKWFYTREHLYYIPPRWVWRMLETTGYKVLRTVSVGANLMGLRIPCPVSLSYQVIYVAQPQAS